jgi:hypothetical protein
MIFALCNSSTEADSAKAAKAAATAAAAFSGEMALLADTINESTREDESHRRCQSCWAKAV